MLNTNVDSILKLLYLDKPVAVEEIATVLKIPEHIVEKIAKYLEEEQILKMQYKFMKPYLVLLKPLDKIEHKGKESRIYPEENADSGVEANGSKDAKNLGMMIELARNYLEKKNLQLAIDVYKKATQTFNNMPDSEEKNNLYKRISDIYDILLKQMSNPKK
ncbi:hypothetical protein HYY70_04665 [Candidatus Woesearchaeota archaeon]|nr:hypothetical protein [Candidatus Woesearchaeota archaeon]